jgi:YVTN family beta-propeller protein
VDYHPRVNHRLLFLFLTCAATAMASTLPTGVALDPAAPAHKVGSFPLAVVMAPEGDRAALLLCGWREQGVQIVDVATGAVTQTLPQPAAFVGLAFSPDGKMLYASGGNEDVIYAYRWSDRQATPASAITLRAKPDPKKSGTSYPAGIAVSPDGRYLYAAENLADTLAVVDLASNTVVQRVETGRYPYAVAADARGNVYVSIWAGREVEVFTLDAAGNLQKRGEIKAGRHPAALLLNRDGSRLFAASPSTDSVAVIDTAALKVVNKLTNSAPGGPSEGSTPNALALSADAKRLFVAEADGNAVAVFDVAAGKLLGRVPTEWYPTALAVAGGNVVVVSGKGSGTAPNPKHLQPHQRGNSGREHTLGQLDGSVMTFPAALTAETLRAYSARVASANGWTRTRSARVYPPFKHVIYVIKENRTYDQILGDLTQADGDPSLNYFPRAVSPNHHALAERFGIFDRFFCNAEVSSQGHNWSTAAYSGEYVEKATQSSYAGDGRAYDYEGTNREKVLDDDDDDVASPSTGYLWDLAAAKGISYRDYGEFVIPAGEYGTTGTGFAPTKRALAEHTDRDFPGFGMRITDQFRADRWIEEFGGFAASGKMPALQIIRLPNDHTAGGAADMPTPRAYMADNDLALGRMINVLSRSRFWRDTVVFVLEDDAQNGPDHVDSHRSVLLTISAYNRPGVVHRFVNTTDVLATIEDILGLRSLSQFDHFGRPMRGLFAGTADMRPYDVIVPEIDLKEKNPKAGPAAEHSAMLDLSRVDAADDELFNRLLWRVIKGEDVPYPGATRAPVQAHDFGR